MHKFPVFFLNSWIVEKIGNAFFILFSLVWLSQIDSKFDGVILFFVQYTMCMKWIGRCTFFPFAHSIIVLVEHKQTTSDCFLVGIFSIQCWK